MIFIANTKLKAYIFENEMKRTLQKVYDCCNLCGRRTLPRHIKMSHKIDNGHFGFELSESSPDARPRPKSKRQRAKRMKTIVQPVLIPHPPFGNEFFGLGKIFFVRRRMKMNEHNFRLSKIKQKN